MTQQEKIAMVKQIVKDDPEATDGLIEVYLQFAAEKILERLFPFDTTKGESDIPVRYHTLQCELTNRLWARKGGEGEISHEENGINRSWSSVDDEDILSRISPYVKVV